MPAKQISTETGTTPGFLTALLGRARCSHTDRERAAQVLRPVDQVGNPIPYRGGNEQSCQRLLRCISANGSAGTSALLINCGGRLTGLACDVASHTLHRIYRLGPRDRRNLTD